MVRDCLHLAHHHINLHTSEKHKHTGKGSLEKSIPSRYFLETSKCYELPNAFVPHAFLHVTEWLLSPPHPGQKNPVILCIPYPQPSAETDKLT